MKFGVRDLFAFTGLAAIYSAIVGYELIAIPQEPMLIRFLIGGICVNYVACLYRNQRAVREAGHDCGALLYTLRTYFPASTHYEIAISFLIMGLVLKHFYIDDPRGLSLMRTFTMPYALIAGYMFTWFDRVSLCENGLVFQRQLWRFGHSRFEIVERRGEHLLVVGESTSWLKQWRTRWPIIPTDQLDEVRQILEEKQGEQR